jgi:hypothetical protein
VNFNFHLPTILIFQVGVLSSDESLLDENAQSMQPRQKESEQSKQRKARVIWNVSSNRKGMCCDYAPCLFFKRLTYQIQSAETRILIVECDSVGITLPTLVQVLPRHGSGHHHQQQLQLLLTIATPCVPSKARASACVWWYAYDGPLDDQPSSAEQDEMNEAAPFSIHQLPKQTKPRVITLEETAGLLSRYTPCFLNLINIFLSL